MAVRGIAGDENPPVLIGGGDRVAQVPKTDMLNFEREFEAGGIEKCRLEIDVLAAHVGLHRRVEEKVFVGINTPKKFPIAVQVRMHHAVGRAFGKALELLVQVA